MMIKCHQCGSGEIVTDLMVCTDQTTSGGMPAYVKLVEPEPARRPLIWLPNEVTARLRAAICGECGHMQLYTLEHAELLAARKTGYTGQP